jgi:hypothetical protein
MSNTIRKCWCTRRAQLYSLFEQCWLQLNHRSDACRVNFVNFEKLTLSGTPVAHIETPFSGLGHRSKTVVSSLPGWVSCAQQLSTTGREYEPFSAGRSLTFGTYKT